MIFAGIVAGGTGSRMGADIPKQFIELGGRPILIYTIEKFLQVSEIDKVYVGVHSEWIDYTNRLISKFFPNSSKTCIVAGGNDRNSTVFNIVDKIKSEYEISDNDIILTHDGVRPFVSRDIILENIKSTIKYNACTTAITAIDTLLYSEDNLTITSTPPRNKMYHAQTPQSFNLRNLLEVYCSLNDGEKALLTDTCSIYTAKGLPVKIVNGDVSNIKITTPFDLKIANSLI